MGPDAGDRPGRDRRGVVAIEVELLLVHPEHVPAIHRLADRVGHGPEVLTDDRRVRRRGLGGDHGQQLLTRIPDVHAVAGARPVGDPPQPVHAHDVVDAQHRRRLPGVGDEALPELVTTASPRRRQLGREPPVLPVGEELVRRSADGHAGGEQLTVRPHLVAAGVAADREIEAEHGPTRPLDRPELAVGEALGELVAAPDQRGRSPLVDRIRTLGAEAGEVGDVGALGDEPGDCGVELGLEVATEIEELTTATSGERAPVDQPGLDRRGRGGEPGVVEVDLVPVQPAHRRVRARVEGLVVERGVQRKRGDDADVEAVRPRGHRRQVGERR